MALMFELQRAESSGGSYSDVTDPAAKGGDLGHWISPRTHNLGQDPGDVWRVVKPVSGLQAPA